VCGSWQRLLLGCGAEFGIWQNDKRPCIIQQELSAAPVLPGITFEPRAPLCPWEDFYK